MVIYRMLVSSTQVEPEVYASDADTGSIFISNLLCCEADTQQVTKHESEYRVGGLVSAESQGQIPSVVKRDRVRCVRSYTPHHQVF